MKNKLIDLSQVIIAIVLTGSTAFAMQPPAEPIKLKDQTAQVSSTNKTPVVAAPEAPEPAPIVEQPVVPVVPEPEPVAPAVAQPEYVPPVGNQYQWLIDSGIPQQYWRAVDYIVSRESGWNPCAFYPGGNDCNASPTTACGLVQQLPCGKIPGDWRDPVAALKWQYQYVTDKYGGYPQAMQYWMENGNY